MSLESFIRLYQELLTMVDPSNTLSVVCAENVLRLIYALARHSGKANSITIRCMDSGVRQFSDLVRHRNEFAGKPGEFHANNAKRQRLRDVLYPHC